MKYYVKIYKYGLHPNCPNYILCANRYDLYGFLHKNHHRIGPRTGDYVVIETENKYVDFVINETQIKDLLISLQKT